MNKKIILGLVAVVVVAGGVAGMSAFEAHIINVTAKIENALAVNTEAIDFGTVFPQEYLERPFTVSLSSSFLAEDQLRLGDVEYKIVQKPKCINDAGEYAPVDYATHECPAGYTEMPDLCRFLSKMCVECDNDTPVASYYNKSTNSCSIPDPHVASGYLVKCYPNDPDCSGPGDIEDCWKVDLKVPPVTGCEGQEWPLSCADWTVPTNGAVYGCDLWIEVTGFSALVEPTS